MSFFRKLDENNTSLKATPSLPFLPYGEKDIVFRGYNRTSSSASSSSTTLSRLRRRRRRDMRELDLDLLCRRRRRRDMWVAALTVGI